MGEVSGLMREDLSSRIDAHTVSQGYKQGSPVGRDRLVLDDVIEVALGRVDVAARLYPEVYAHIVAEAVLKYMDAVETS